MAEITKRMEVGHKEIERLDGLIQALMKKVHPIRDQIKELQPGLSDLAMLKSALANPASRDKYFPEHSKNSFLEHVKKTLNG